MLLGMLHFACAVMAQPDGTSSGNNLEELGTQLTKAFKKNDTVLVKECFFTKEEVVTLLQLAANDNAGKGSIEFNTDSIYTIFCKELLIAFEEVRKQGESDTLNWKKIKFVEMGLSGVNGMGEFKTGDLVLVVRRKDKYYMITFPESFALSKNWKIGPMISWVGRVSK